MSRQALFLFLMLWLTGHVSADGGDDFANNLASDLGPIIALFGERVVMQFMSQAMGLADCVLLAVAPIGAITTVVSAIRVAGPAWLRSFIGRARENLQAAEIDVMSSTSKEVCELWNGNSVVRCPGSADISQFICLVPKTATANLTLETMNLNYITLQQADEYNLLSKITTTGPTYVFRCIMSLLRREKQDLEKDSGDKHPDVYVVMDRLNEDAPNLLLNCHDRVGRMEIYLAAIFGILLQLGAIIYFGLITYDQAILGQFLKGGKRAVGYAFPCAAAGTVLLAFGLFLCGWVVQKSTTETCYQADGHQIFIVWLQKDHTVSDQVFKPFAICPTSNREYIILSRRNDQLAKQKIKEFIVHTFEHPIFEGPKEVFHLILNCISGKERSADKDESRNKNDERKESCPLGLVAAFGALISLVGFISQFVGMRGLSWTASIMQLAITILMTVIRVIVRRGLGKNPIRVRLKSNFELDWFALSFGDLSKAIWARAEESGGDSWKWSIKTGGEQAYSTLKKTDDNNVPIDKFSKAHKMMVVRQNLGKLSNWRSPIREEAARLSTAIELVAQTFLERGSDTTLWWKIPAIYEDREEHIYIQLERKGTKWSINVEEIDAILSLWLYSVSSTEKVTNACQRCNVRLFGSSRFKKRLVRDLRWWIPEIIPEIDTLPRAEIKKIYSGCSVVGFTSETGNKKKNSNNVETENELEEYLVLECQDTQERLFSRDLLFSFIRAAAKFPGFISPIALSRGRMKATEMAKGWKKMKIKYDDIVTLVRKIENIGFGTPSDIYFDLIASLSLEQKLTINNIRDEAIKQVQEYERSCHWKQLVDNCSFLLDLAYEFDLEKEPSGPLVIAVCFGTLDGLRYEAQLQRLEGRIEKTLETQLKILEEKFYIFEDSTFSAWMKIGSPDKCYSITVFDRLIGSSIDKEKEFPDSFKITSEHLKIIRTDDLAESVCLQSGGLEKVDSFGWSLLHYAVNLRQLRDKTIVFLSQKSALQMGELQRGLTSKLDIDSLQDYRGWTPLHYACLVGNEKAVDLLLGHHAQIDKAGVDGITPIHCAVEGGNAAILRKLLEKFDSKQQNSVLPLDRNQRHPIHWAAVRGKFELVELLKDGINLKDRFGWTCLHLAVIHKHEKICHYIARQSEADINMRDNDCRTPLHLAIEFKSSAVLEVLLSARADVDAKLKDGSTPLHMAVEKTQILQKLLKRGADVDAVDVEGRTPLYRATAAGNADAVKLLIEEGAEITIAAKDGKTPLHMAISQKDIAQQLLEKGADFNAIDIEDHTPLYLALRGGTIEVANLLIAERESTKTSAKSEKTARRHLTVKIEEMKKLLLESRPDMNMADKQEPTPLYKAMNDVSEIAASLIDDDDEGTLLQMALNRGEDWLEIAKKLLPSISIDGSKIFTNTVTRYGSATPLHVAATYDSDTAINMFLKNGTDINATDEYGQTALLIAIYHEKWENATTLLNANADIKADHRGGYTPLLGAVVGRNLDIVNRLLTANADVQVADEDGNSPLHLAVSGDDISIIERLLTFGANIDAVNAVNGQTPLHVAVVKGFTDTVALLLEKKAKTGLLDRFDFSPLQYALYYGNLEIVRLLVKHESGHVHAKINGSLRKSSGVDTPLHTLCRWGRNVSDDETMCAIFDELRSIISRNDLNTKDRDGYRPLDLAVSVVGGYRNFIKKLVDEGAESGLNLAELDDSRRVS